MTVFTGRLGTPNSKFGQILLAAVDGLVGIDFRAHQLTSTQVRVLFGFPVTDSALEDSNYVFTAVAPSTTFIPSIRSVDYYDETRESVVVTFFLPLTTGAEYTVTISDVAFDSGETMAGAFRNFTANVFDPPRAMGAHQSKRGSIDILFDKDVGVNSAAATFEVRDPAGGPGVPAVQMTWAGEDLPETTLRIELPVGMPTSNALVVDFVGVTDVSLNPSSETVPVTHALRSTAPFAYADYRQLQLVDAYVTDVSSDFLRTANVRVFFNGPVSNATTIANWTAAAAGAHSNVDTENPSTAPDATDLATLVTLTNDLKAAFNAHIVESTVHVMDDNLDRVTAADAMDLPTSAVLLNQLQTKYLLHLARHRVHVYQDTINIVAYTEVPSSGGTALVIASSVANGLKSGYDGHLLEEYPLAFSTAYGSPVGEITALCTEDVPDTAFDVVSPFTYYADLRLILDTDAPDINLTATLTSEDAASSTNPADFTGSITARGASSAGVLTSHLVRPDTDVVFRFDKGMLLTNDGEVEIAGPDGLEIPTELSLTSTMASVFWAHNNAVEAYRLHIAPGGAGHQADDGVNVLIPSDYATLPLSSAIDSVNAFRLKLLAHVASNVFHYHADPDTVRAPEATDEESLVALVADLQRVVASHNVRIGPHAWPGYRMVSAPLYDVLYSTVQRMVDGEDHTLRGLVRSGNTFNGPPVSPAPSEPVRRFMDVALDLTFTGLAVRPSLASAIPNSGLAFMGEELRLEQDSVLVFFSKSMHMIPLGSSNVTLTGGAILQKETAWNSSMVASAAVIRMQSIPYSVTVSGLTDEAGNPTY